MGFFQVLQKSKDEESQVVETTVDDMILAAHVNEALDAGELAHIALDEVLNFKKCFTLMKKCTRHMMPCCVYLLVRMLIKNYHDAG